MSPTRASLYAMSDAPALTTRSSPQPAPWTIETKTHETIDNDRAPMMLAAGVIR